MIKQRWIVATLLAAAACVDDDTVPVPTDPEPEGDGVAWSCAGQVTYDWCISDPSCIGDVFGDLVATVQVDGCLQTRDGSFDSAAADAACEAACLDAVETDGTEQGQDVANIVGCDQLVAVDEGTCELAAELVEELELTYIDPAGRSERARGKVRYVLDPAGRTRRTGRVVNLALDAPFTYTVAERHVSVLTGYPVGTVIEVSQVGLGRRVALDLDGRGSGRIAAGTPVTAVIEVTEPGGTADLSSVWAALPWDVTLTATDTSFAIDVISDGLGGRLEVR